MTYLNYQETMGEAMDRGQAAAKRIGEAGNEAAKKIYKKAQDAAENIGESVNDAANNLNEAAKNLNEAAKEHWGEVTQYTDDHGNVLFGVFVTVSSTLFFYGICKVINYFQKPKKGA